MANIRCLARNCNNWRGMSDCAGGAIVLGPGGMCGAYVETVRVPERRTRAVVTTRTRGTVTYRLEMVSCGKCAKCKEHGPSHGPYWYAYWKEGGRTRSRYLGRGAVIVPGAEGAREDTGQASGAGGAPGEAATPGAAGGDDERAC
jgi:hypothetical protein